MNKKLEKTLLEMFGDPLESIYGTKIGDVEDIADVGAVGARGVSEDAVVCPTCGEMPIDGQCGCANSVVCPMCGQMPPNVEAPCSCGLMEGTGVSGECKQCSMKEIECECGMNKSDMEEVAPPGHEKNGQRSKNNRRC
jgi:hypothetical protein